MRKTVRSKCFETNSSSLHSIIVARGHRHIPDYMTKKPVEVTGGEFGWQFESYRDPVDKLNYIYSGASAWSDDDSPVPHLLEKVKKALESVGVEIEWSAIGQNSWNRTGYVDHSYNLKDFLVFLDRDPENILDFVFDDNSAVGTGNDNDDEGCADVEPPAGIEYEEFFKGN